MSGVRGRCWAAALLALACSDGERLRDDPHRIPWPTPVPLPAEVPVVPVSPIESANCNMRLDLRWCTPDVDQLEPRAARAELLRAAALDVLGRHCAECHSSAASTPLFREPLAIDDFEDLVRRGYVLPLKSAASPLVQQIASGAMPPPSSRAKPVTESELASLMQWIDTPSFWPEAGSAEGCEPVRGLVPFDQLLEIIAEDLSHLPDMEQQFYRYVSLSDRASAACSEGAVELERRAWIKGLNMLSLSQSVHAPLAIDEGQSIYRIDLRDFAWTRGIQVGTENYNDVWEAIAARSPYSVELQGDTASRLAQGTRTRFPVLFADQLLDEALAGELYYAILGIKPDGTLGDWMLQEAGIDEDEQLQERLLRRAATSQSRFTEDDHVVQREEMSGGRGAVWQAFDFISGAQSIFEEPIYVGGDGDAQVMFTLPNGLFGFLIADGSGLIVPQTEMRVDALGYELPASTAASCSGCHVAGLIPVVDEVRRFSRDYPRQYDAETFTLIEQIYLEPASFSALLQSDSAPYQRALTELGLPTDGIDPVAAASLRFGVPLTLRDAAAELGVSSDALAQSLSSVAPWLEPLQTGTLGRDVFATLYLASRCVLSEGAGNRPDPSACERALANVRR